MTSADNAAQTTATVTAVVLRPGHGTGDFEVSGELPPGMSRSQLEQGWEKRMLDGMRRLSGNPPLPPSRVRNLKGDVRPGEPQGAVTMRWDTPRNQPTGGYLAEVERPWGNVIIEGSVPAGNRTIWIYGRGLVTRHPVLTPGYYFTWVAAQNCDVGGCATGPWALDIVRIEEMVAESPDPPTGVQWERGSWDCSLGACRNNGSTLVNSVTNAQLYRFQRRPSGEDWLPYYDSSDPSVNEGVDPGTGQVRARVQVNDLWSEWSLPVRYDARPTSSDYSSNGSLPDAPRNVMIQNIGTNRWRFAWDPPTSHGGWEIQSYRYGDTGRTERVINEGTPQERTIVTQRTCVSNLWSPPYQFTIGGNRVEGHSGRTYSVEVDIHLPRNWTLSITAVNGKGEGPCAAATR